MTEVEAISYRDLSGRNMEIVSPNSVVHKHNTSNICNRICKNPFFLIKPVTVMTRAPNPSFSHHNFCEISIVTKQGKTEW